MIIFLNKSRGKSSFFVINGVKIIIMMMILDIDS